MRAVNILKLLSTNISKFVNMEKAMVKHVYWRPEAALHRKLSENLRCNSFS
uniref:Uncharacterized protein n=1 Tax=Arundo donax TaxID=35708 RepID=A0A0A8Y365_ARUDO